MHAYRGANSDDTSPSVVLPPGRHLAVTWGIPDEYGGMTAAMLRRSRQFALRAGVDVDLLTFDERPDQGAIERRLRADGALTDGIRLHGLYAHSRQADRSPIDVPRPVGTPHRGPDEEESGSDGSVRRWREGGKTVRVEHLRLDGTTAVVDEHRPGARLITTFDARGRTTGQWRSAAAFRFAWLDEYIGDGAAVVIVDSKTAARFMQHYRRRSVTLVHVVHGAHHDEERRLSRARQTVFEALPLWDSVVFLTERQRAAVAASLGETGNLAVVPNSIDVPERRPGLPADRLHGVIVTRMTRIKRLDHALAVIARVRELGVPVTADIVGDGPERVALEREASRLGLSHAVRFTGFVPHGAALLRDGAWTLLTSRSEGESLMLLEAMAAECLPVAYDIRYGPSELIADGRSGRLVPDGDMEAAARALVDLCQADEEKLVEMRRHARGTAERFGHDATVGRWADVVSDAVRRHGARASVDEAALRRVRVRVRGGRHVITAIIHGRLGRLQLQARLVNRDGEAAVARMRAWGPLRLARLTEGDSRRLGRGTVRTVLLVTSGDITVGVDAGVRRPDPRSLVRRVLGRLRRRASRARTGRSRSTVAAKGASVASRSG